MFPAFYQTTLRAHLNESQYLTLQLLLLLLQAHRQVKLSLLASVFPQPIQYQSRKRNLQRFLVLPQLSVKLLWFPLIKYWMRQAQTGRNLNRDQRRRLSKLQHQRYGYWLIVMDRSQWKERNVFMVSLVWGTHALPVYWELLEQVGNSDLNAQKRLLKVVLPLFKNYRVLVLGDREFHSPKLAQWLDQRGVSFALRQKKDCHFQQAEQEDYQVLKHLGFKPGMSKFYQGIRCNQGDGIGPFNLAIYWRRKYNNAGAKEPWYILTNLPTLKQALAVYRCRWRIEEMFRDFKGGGYHLAATNVEGDRLIALVLLIAIAYTAATMNGQKIKRWGIEKYVGRVKEADRTEPRHSHFYIGLYGQTWVQFMAPYAEIVAELLQLSPHKQPYYRKGMRAMRLIQSAL
jgi:hypothetical protein